MFMIQGIMRHTCWCDRSIYLSIYLFIYLSTIYVYMYLGQIAFVKHLHNIHTTYNSSFQRMVHFWDCG